MSNAAIAALVQHPRHRWTPRARPRPLTPVLRHPYAEVHHSGARVHYQRLLAGAGDVTARFAQLLRDIEADHLGRGWNGFFYGVAINPVDGSLWAGREVGWRSIGDHAERYHDGTRVDPHALCVLVPGDWRFDPVPRPVLDTLDRIRAAIPDPRLRWHGMRPPATACPGTNMVAELERLNTRPPGDTMETEPPKLARHDGQWYIIRPSGLRTPISDGDAWVWGHELEVIPSTLVPLVIRGTTLGPA